MQIKVSSEIGKLQGVIVHTPGHEVSLVNPDLKDELLFDDIIFEEDARREHLNMIDVFQTAMGKTGKVYEIVDLLCEAFDEESARAHYIEQLIRAFPEYNISSVEKQLLDLNRTELLDLIMQGQHPRVENFNMHPSPNLLFTRDLAAVINDHVLISRAAKRARLRESLMVETLVDHHPLFKDIKKNAIRIEDNQSIEGGDVLVESNDVVMIGMSERTSFSGLMKAAEALLDGVTKHIVAVDIPKQRASMHLDTIFTFASENECVAFPPAIMEQSNNVVMLSRPGDKVIAETVPSLEYALNDFLGRDYTLIKCGGEDRTTQFREQWTDGANIFALAPGVIVGYERNTETFNTLINHGYRYLTQFEFIEEYEDKTLEENIKLAISFEGNELCRGRGGARCMTMPISRNN